MVAQRLEVPPADVQARLLGFRDHPREPPRVAHGGGHRAEVVLGFDDDPVAELLGIDPEDEAPLELIPVGSGAAVREAPAVETIDPAEKSLSETRRNIPSSTTPGARVRWTTALSRLTGARQSGTLTAWAHTAPATAKLSKYTRGRRDAV